MTHLTCGTPLSARDRERVRTLIARIGERGAQRALGVSRQTLARALSGLPVQRGTIALITGALASGTGGEHARG